MPDCCVRRCDGSICPWRPARSSLHRLAVLLGTAAPEPRPSMHTLDGSAAHEAIDVDACQRSLRGNADDCVRQLGRVLCLGCMGSAVLPNVLKPKPDPHHAAPATHVPLWHHRECHNRAHDWARRRRAHRRYGHAPDGLR